MPLEEYKTIVGAIAGVVTIAQFFSPVFMCKNIIKKGNTKNVDGTPFIGGLGIAILMLQHGLILKDSTMILVNVFAFVLNTIYLIIYFKYSDKKAEVWQSLCKILGLALLLIGYAQIEWRISEERLNFNYGLIVTVLMLTLIASPLFNLKTIVASKSTESLPFPLILSGTVVTFLWLLYGIIIDNVFVQIQNAVGFLLNAVQLSLFVIFPSRPVKRGKKKE